MMHLRRTPALKLSRGTCEGRFVAFSISLPCLVLRPQQQYLSRTRRSYFTNGERTKGDDPYAILGMQWGDGATTTEIRTAFRTKAKELHPDVVDRNVMTLQEAHEQFQKLVTAYETLTKTQNDNNDSIEEWRVSLWRKSDRIAQDRTDVAGVARKRPAKPAQTSNRIIYSRELGHPNGIGLNSIRKGEYLSAATTTNDGSVSSNRKKLRSSSVGRGQSKWGKRRKQKEQYKEWSPSRTISTTDNNT